MYTTRQIAKRAGKSDNTIRNWVEVYPDLFSPSAQPDSGVRVFTEEDAAMCEALATLTGTGLPVAEAANRLRVQGAQAVVNATAQTLQPSLQDPATGLQAHDEAAAMLQQAFNALQRRLEVLEQAQADHPAKIERAELRGALMTVAGMLIGLAVIWLFMGASS